MNEIIDRRPGEYIPFETRAESHEKVNKDIRYIQILEILADRKMTAKQIAVEMYRRKLTPTPERNFSAPRLTELSNKGVVEVCGKTKCEYCGKLVSVYRKRKENEDD